MEKKLIEYTTTTAIWTKPITEQKEVYIETKTITEEVVRHKDQIESLITQKTNDIENLQIEITWLQAKLDDINLLSKK